jgi:hypothetical protein
MLGLAQFVWTLSKARLSDPRDLHTGTRQGSPGSGYFYYLSKKLTVSIAVGAQGNARSKWG